LKSLAICDSGEKIFGGIKLRVWRNITELLESSFDNLELLPMACANLRKLTLTGNVYYAEDAEDITKLVERNPNLNTIIFIERKATLYPDGFSLFHSYNLKYLEFTALNHESLSEFVTTFTSTDTLILKDNPPPRPVGTRCWSYYRPIGTCILNLNQLTIKINFHNVSGAKIFATIQNLPNNIKTLKMTSVVMSEINTVCSIDQIRQDHPKLNVIVDDII
jgi:hypothetical protein